MSVQYETKKGSELFYGYRVPGPKRSGGPEGSRPRTVLTVIGARPQFVKAAIVSRRLRDMPGIVERIVHTGQHYDDNMSRVFFDQLGLAEPDFRLNARASNHGEQTARMLTGLERIMIDQRPSAVLVYGDTNSTLAAALAASKLAIPLVHVEAGLRSHDRAMPEEINRTITDRLSQLLLCPTPQAVDQLAAEGITQGVHLVGDVMYDAAVHFADRAQEAARGIFERFNLAPRGYVLWTCHRAANVDDPTRLAAIMAAAHAVARRLPVVFPVHPRTQKRTQKRGQNYLLSVQKRVLTPFFVEPVSYLEMLALQRDAAVVVTDSGGMQKEAFILGTPCVTVRENTEWTETIDAGANCLVPADTNRIVAAVCRQLTPREPLPDAAYYYGGGQAVPRVVQAVTQLVKQEIKNIHPLNPQIPKSLIPNP